MDDLWIWTYLMSGASFMALLAKGSIAPSISFRTNASDGTNLTTYSFTTQDIGTAGANRTVILLIAGISAGGGAVTVSSATIGGITANVQKHQAGVGGSFSTILTAAVPTGATATVAFTMSNTLARVGIGIWAAFDLASAVAVNTAGSNSTAASVNMNTVIGDLIIVGGFSNDTPGGSGATATGYTERFDADVESTCYSGGDFTAVATETPRTLTLTWAVGTNCGVAAATFR